MEKDDIDLREDGAFHRRLQWSMVGRSLDAVLSIKTDQGDAGSDERVCVSEKGKASGCHVEMAREGSSSARK